MRLRTIAGLGLLLFAAPLEAQEEPSDRDFRVTDIRARLLYEASGNLSVDISDNPRFTAFNTVIGEGDAEENASDLLVTALVEGPAEHNLTVPLILTARDARGRVLGNRRFEGILAGRRTQRSLLLHDVGCAGAIRLTAELGASRRSEEVRLPCGE